MGGAALELVCGDWEVEFDTGTCGAAVGGHREGDGGGADSAECRAVFWVSHDRGAGGCALRELPWCAGWTSCSEDDSSGYECCGLCDLSSLAGAGICITDAGGGRPDERAVCSGGVGGEPVLFEERGEVDLCELSQPTHERGGLCEL